jgi:hypothetical protein
MRFLKYFLMMKKFIPETTGLQGESGSSGFY